VIRAALLALGLSLGANAAGAQEAGLTRHTQLAASVQHDLNVLGFGEVDARSLSLRQLAALHTQIDGRLAGLGPRWIDARGRVKAILRIDGFRTFTETGG
jgi:hypothetical protein